MSRGPEDKDLELTEYMNAFSDQESDEGEVSDDADSNITLDENTEFAYF